MSDIGDEPPPVLLPCTICSRTFRPEVLERHVKVCEKTASKKRRVFDSFKSRVSGTELEEFLGPAPLPGQIPKRPCKSPVKKRSSSKWKETHENLIATLRAARGVEPPSDTMIEASKHAGNEQCPSCYRFFGPRAFDRHVEFCKEKTARIKMTPSKVSQAQERLEARTKYRAPLSLKTKMTTKEKYSPMPTRKESVESCSVSSAKTSPPIPTISRNLKAGKTNSSSFTRQSPVRSSERQRSVSPTKKSLSSSKASIKNEVPARTGNQPKIKENLKSPDDLRPKTSSKTSAQEKIRNRKCRVDKNVRTSHQLPSDLPFSNLFRSSKQSQLEDEPCKFNKKTKRKTISSDNESIGTIESEMSENSQRKKKSNLDSLNRTKIMTPKNEKPNPPEDTKSGKKNKQTKLQINDLSVNDESFGIFVAACSVRPPSSKVSKTNLNTVKISPKNSKRERNKHSARSNRKPDSAREEVKSTEPEEVKNTTAKPDKISKIPKPKNSVKTENSEITVSESFKKPEEETIKEKSKKWQNISELSTEKLQHLAEDIDISTNVDVEGLTETAIWEIAAEQFLNSEEPIQSVSAFSADSLNEKQEAECLNVKKNTGGDDLIFLHVTDPAKLIENEAHMKLSVSEPCFPYFNKIENNREKPPESTEVDIVVFTASPNAIQSKIFHRKRKKQKRRRKLRSPEFSCIREKTFLANDIPKNKRLRKISDLKPSRYIDFGESFFESSPQEQREERKRKFIDSLKSQREKIRKWQITANSHIRFMEKFQKSIEDDLKELKNLSKGKKIVRRSSLKEFKKKKMKEMKEKEEKIKRGEVESVKEVKNKKFEYFEIDFKNDADCSTQSRKKRFECFEITNDFFKNDKPDFSIEKTNDEEKSEESFDLSVTHDSPETVSYQNNSLENIEEVDESTGEETTVEKNIEIEDFILSKPNTQKIISKKGNFLDELFPKPRKISEMNSLSDSATAVPLGFSADSVFDLKSNEGKKLKVVSKATIRSTSTRMLQKRMKKESHLPQILAKNMEQKENSMISLIDVWKNKKRSSKNEIVYKAKSTLPIGKLPPLTNKNSLQIKTSPNDSYDPFKQAERQMLALLSWPSTADIKTAKNVTPTSKPKPKTNAQQNLETSPTSAFTKYPNKDDKTVKNNKTARKSLNETFEVKKNSLNEKPTYTAADDWEQIFEKHFDLNRNEMTESVKSALDGLLKSTMKNKTGLIEDELSPPKNKSEDSSIITEVLYTSTPKHNSKSDKGSQPRSRGSVADLEQTYNKNNTYNRGISQEDFDEALRKGKKPEKPNRNSGISLSSLSFCSQISDTTLADEEVMRSNLELIGKAAAVARTPRRKYARSQSVFDERNKMLFAKTYDPDYSSSDENPVDECPKTVVKNEKSPRNPNPKSGPSHFYRSQSVMHDKCKGDGEQSEDGGHISSPENNRNRKAKMSGDSAYSSLNRRSPRQKSHNQQEDRLSSSGSEHSFPAINDYNLKPKSLDFNEIPSSPKKGQQPVKMSKFCHECGSKYPVVVAKFCCECGVRRLII